MKLIDLIDYFRNGGDYDEFCKKNELSLDSEVIEIYAELPIALNSDLGFFPIEETHGKIDFIIGEKAYRNLFSFFYFFDAMEEAKEMKEISNEVLAEKLFLYAKNDA
jgi:hypothetical protein